MTGCISNFYMTQVHRPSSQVTTELSIIIRRVDNSSHDLDHSMKALSDGIVDVTVDDTL